MLSWIAKSPQSGRVGELNSVAGVALEAQQRGRTPAALALGGHVVLVAALNRALETAVHAGPVGVEIVGIERRMPGGGLVVQGTQRAEHARRLVEEGRTHLLQRVLDHRGRGDRLADDLVVALEFLDHRRLGGLALDHDGLQAQRSHLRPAPATRPDRLDAAHDAAAQHQVLAGTGNPCERHVLALGAVEVALDDGSGIEVVEPDIGRGVEKGIAVRRATGEVAARRRGHASGQGSRAENQRDFGVESIPVLL